MSLTLHTHIGVRCTWPFFYDEINYMLRAALIFNLYLELWQCSAGHPRGVQWHEWQSKYPGADQVLPETIKLRGSGTGRCSGQCAVAHMVTIKYCMLHARCGTNSVSSVHLQRCLWVHRLVSPVCHALNPRAAAGVPLGEKLPPTPTLGWGFGWKVCEGRCVSHRR